MTRDIFLCLLVAIGVSIVAGCRTGELPTYPISGTVSFEDGQPVQTGSIEFYNEKHDLTARGNIGDDGTYQLSTFQSDDGAIAGDHQVVIIQMLMPGPVIPGKGTGVVHGHGRHVDTRYANYETSPLKCTVENRDDSCDFTVKGSK